MWLPQMSLLHWSENRWIFSAYIPSTKTNSIYASTRNGYLQNYERFPRISWIIFIKIWFKYTIPTKATSVQLWDTRVHWISYQNKCKHDQYSATRPVHNHPTTVPNIQYFLPRRVFRSTRTKERLVRKGLDYRGTVGIRVHNSAPSIWCGKWNIIVNSLN